MYKPPPAKDAAALRLLRRLICSNCEDVYTRIVLLLYDKEKKEKNIKVNPRHLEEVSPAPSAQYPAPSTSVRSAKDSVARCEVLSTIYEHRGRMLLENKYLGESLKPSA